MSLADARRKAKLVQGTDHPAPLGPAAMTFAEARASFIDDTRPRTKARTVAEYERLLKRHFTFEKKLATVSRQEIVETIAGLRKKPSIEHHAFVAIRTMMNWCVRQGILENSPVPRLRFKTTSRSRVLNDDELKAVSRRAIEFGYPFGTIVQLLILTGQRRGEIAELRRSWIDNDTITYPEGFTKNKREHRIPLGATAKSIIEAIPDVVDLLFPARGEGKEELPFNGWGKAKREFDKPLSLAPYTLHDLRRTFASNLARLETPIHVTERLLNHISGSFAGVAGVYNRYPYFPEMQKALRAYEAHLESLLTDQN
jgi:integrase